MLDKSELEQGKGGRMEEGMTDKQFNGFLRLLLSNLEEVIAEKDETKRNKKLNKVIENIQKTIED